MSREQTSQHNRRPRQSGSPADRAIVMMGCLGGAISLLVVTVAAMLADSGTSWLLVGPAGVLALSAVAWCAWRRVSLHGYFHDRTEDDDEDGNPEGGSGVRSPPDAPDGGGSLEFDWDAFLAGFWEHVEADARDSGSQRALR